MPGGKVLPVRQALPREGMLRPCSIAAARSACGLTLPPQTLVDAHAFAVALALYGPEVSLACHGHKVYASVPVGTHKTARQLSSRLHAQGFLCTWRTMAIGRWDLRCFREDMQDGKRAVEDLRLRFDMEHGKGLAKLQEVRLMGKPAPAQRVAALFESFMRAAPVPEKEPVFLPEPHEVATSCGEVNLVHWVTPHVLRFSIGSSDAFYSAGRAPYNEDGSAPCQDMAQEGVYLCVKSRLVTSKGPEYPWIPGRLAEVCVRPGVRTP